jgi:hypothetical protein
LRVLGQEHPSTLNSMANLAHTLHCVGRIPEAITMMGNALVHQLAKLGADHPETKESQVTLRSWNKVLYTSLYIWRLHD